MPTHLSSATLNSEKEVAPGRLVVVVGPSGCGKDTLLDAARAVFADDPHVHFARRDITRPSSAGGENHRALTTVEFEHKLEAGAYPLHWDAHQLRYGVANTELAPLERGEAVVLNGSRAVLDHVVAFHPNTRVISIRVQQDILEERLRNRGREGNAAVDKRLSRATAYDVAGPHVIEIWNDGTVEEGVARFLKAMSSAMA